MFLLLSSFSCIWLFDFSSTTKLISFVESSILVSALFIFILLSYILWRKYRNEEDLEESWYFYEFFAGLKSSKRARIYTTTSLARRFILASILTFGYSLKWIYLIWSMIGYQLIHIPMLLYIRAYNQFSVNFIEILNEMTYTILAWMLIKYHSSDVWGTIPINIFWWLIFANSWIVMIVFIGKDYIATHFLI